MKFGDIPIAIVLASFMAMAMIPFIVYTIEAYNVPIEPQYQQTFNKLNNTFENQLRGSQEQFSGPIEGSGKVTDTTNSGLTLEGAFSILKIPFIMIDIVDDVTTTATQYIGLPKWIGHGITWALVATLVYLITAIVMRAYGTVI